MYVPGEWKKIKEENTFEVRTRESSVLENQTQHMMNDQMHSDVQQVNKSELKENFLNQTKNMKDTAKLGKTTWKAKTEEEVQRNEKIESSKKLTKKATAYTQDIYHTLQDVLKEEDDEKSMNEQDRRRKSAESVLFRLEHYDFRPEMFLYSNIAEHLKSYIYLINDFEFVDQADELTIPDDQRSAYRERIERLRPVIDSLKSRLQVYCEQNRVSLTGEILEDKEEGRTLTRHACEKWYDAVQKYNDEKRKTPAKAQQSKLESKEKQEEIVREDDELAETLQSMFEIGEELEKESGEKPMEDERAAAIVMAEVHKEAQILKGKALEAELKEQEDGSGTAEQEEELKEIQEDNRRLQARKIKEEIGMPNEQAEVQGAKQIRMTREEAISSDSDIHSNASRDKLRKLNEKLREAGDGRSQIQEIADIVNRYVEGTRYKVGYTNEREYLIAAQNAINEAIEKEKRDKNVVAAMRAIQDYFKEMTNGSLKKPKNEIYDCSKKVLEEKGSHAGHNRTKALRAFNVWSDEKDTPLFTHEPTINDLKQRYVSNCYMLASIIGLINQNPDLIKKCIRDNGNGTVTVRLYVKETAQKEDKQDDNMEDKTEELLEDDFEELDLDTKKEDEEDEEDDINHYKPVYIKVKKEIPRLFGTVDMLSAGALWMQMIEKACAFGETEDKKVTGYQALWYGTGGDFMTRLIGVRPKRVEVKADEDDDVLYQKFLHAKEEGYVYNAGTIKGHTPSGLSSGHAYAILGAAIRGGEKCVLLRNPYSTCSMNYKADETKSTSTRFWFDPLQTSSDETYGQFYMKISDFRKYFTNIQRTNVGKAFPDEREIEK